ncbi:MAG: aldehyde dehydrogenase family protein [Armatimonadota bacterium]|nr:aldehyde dehydrogenase family protein [Armatimonadota bacterium]MDR7519497.1 aldehyde dehydrogenase family protein [Armatimonadota bacterium]
MAIAAGEQTYKNFIAGRWQESMTDRLVANRNPATGEVLGWAPLSSREEARAAVAAAAEALPRWRETPGPVRGRLLFKVLEIFEREIPRLAEVLTREEGKTLAEARGELQRSRNILEYIAGEGRRLRGETLPSEVPHTFTYTRRDPLGVVALITPWNFPAAIPIWKIAPALVCGNTVVFKPATLTPWTASLLLEIFQDAGLPPGVLNMVIGPGATVGDELIAHPAVRAVSFTGSTEVGTRLYQQAAASGKRVQAEMGGKNPVVVLDDADLDLAVAGTIQGAYGSTGQRCTATSRVIVTERIADRFVEDLATRASRLVVGDGLDPATEVGPSVDESQMKTVLRYIEIGQREGARLVVGGGRLTDEAHANGYFVAPTVFDHVTPQMRIFQEEIFGPVLSVCRVSDFDAAVEAANAVRFGLASSIYTRDMAAAMRFVDRSEVGIVHINNPTVGGEAHLPFGGTKATGVGPREQGSVAIDFYSELKVVYLDYAGARRAESFF